MKLNLIPTARIICMITQFDLKNAIIRLVDGATGTGKPNKLDIKVGSGTLTYDETVVREYTLDRGRLSTVRNGNESPMDVAFDIIWEFIKGGASSSSVASVEDALKQRGSASGWVSSDADTCTPYALDLEIFYDPLCTVDQIENIVLPDFRYEKLNHDAKAGMIKCSGKCNATQAVITRLPQT